QHRVAVEEGAAAGVLADQAQAVAGVEQGGVGQVFGKAPVARDLAGGHLLPVLVNPRHARVQLDVFGQGVDGPGQFAQPVRVHRGVDAVGQRALEVAVPVDGQVIVVRIGVHQLGGDLAGVHLVAVAVHQRLGVGFVDGAVGD